MRSMRALAVAVAAATVTLTACGGQSAQPSSPSGPPSPAAPSSAVQLPGTQVGEELGWVIDAVGRAPVEESELAAHFTPEFLKQVPAAELNKSFQSVRGLRLEKLTDVQDTALVADVAVGAQKLQLTITVDASGKIGGLLLAPPTTPKAAPAGWAELDERLRKVAPEVGFLAAEVTPEGECRPVRSVLPDQARPLGSMFKLYVLGAVAERIADGAFGWDTQLTIKPDLKSLPGGTLQDRPDNSEVPVLEAAKLMISISDNTATDLLIDKVGRTTVEDKVRDWSGPVKRNTPFLTTRELFVLKGAAYPEHAKRYLSLGTEGRRAYLKDTVAKVPLTDVKPWTEPRELDTLEWFGSPADVCRAHAALMMLDSTQVDQVMSEEDSGLELDPKQWPSVWFKGGSEPGVLDLGFSARRADGGRYVVTMFANDPAKPFDEAQVATELLALTKGAFTLLE